MRSIVNTDSQYHMHTVLERLHDIATWQDDWNGYGALMPEAEVILQAGIWCSSVYALCYLTARPWHHPQLIVPEADGTAVLFEWAHGDAHLAVFVSVTSVEYSKDPDVTTFFGSSDGELNALEDFLPLWDWFCDL